MRDGLVSRTAQGVAAHRLRLVRVPAAGSPQHDEVLTRDVAAGLDAPSGRLHEYLRARTAFFDHAVVEAIDAGITQVVIVGAGYDGRAWRYARHGVTFFEVDHPSTQRDKLARLERLRIPTEGIAFVGVDLDVDALPEGMRASGFDAERPSLAIVEGLLAYLELPTVVKLLGDLRGLAAPGSRLAISVGLRRRVGRRAARRVAAFRARVAALGEPIRSQLDARDARPLLEHAGWKVPSGAAAGDERLGLLRAVPSMAPVSDRPHA